MAVYNTRSTKMVLTNEIKDYFYKLAKSENINELFEKFKTDVLSKLEERI